MVRKRDIPGIPVSRRYFYIFNFEEMNIDPKNPDMEERDRFVLSKGHTAPGLYSDWLTEDISR